MVTVESQYENVRFGLGTRLPMQLPSIVSRRLKSYDPRNRNTGDGRRNLEPRHYDVLGRLSDSAERGSRNRRLRQRASRRQSREHVRVGWYWVLVGVG